MRALFVLALGSACAATALGAPAFELSDARHLVALSEPAISPDGTRVAYVRSAANFSDDRNDRSIVLVDTRTHASRVLVRERKGIGGLQWARNGDALFFTASSGDGDNDKTQVYELPMNGGDAFAVTASKHDVSEFAVRPDGLTIAYVTTDDNPRQKEIDAHLDAFEVGNNDYLRKSAEMNAHLWFERLGQKTAHRLTSGPWHTQGVAWSPDGRSLAYTWLPTPYVGDSLAARAELVNASNGARRALDGKLLEGGVTFAPHRGALAYVRSTGGDSRNGNDLYVTDENGRAITDLRRAGVDRNVDGYAWDPHGGGLYVVTPDRTRRALWYLPLHGVARRIALGDLNAASIGNVANDGTAVIIAATSTRPGELYLVKDGNVTRMTRDNAFAERLAVARTLGVTWHASKGAFEENGVLTYPLHRRGATAPLVLLIHGGPQGASSLAWSTLRQEIAARGYFVFEPNYRGGTDQGDGYQRAIANDNGDGPGKDVMAGVAAVESAFPIDRSREAVSGWSYGGFMTSWLIGHYHNWKAAVSGASLDDWFDDYSLAFYVYTDVPFFRGVPYDPRNTQEWIDQSPITYAPQITTPTLIMGDIGDDNVVITNSFKLYHAIKDNGTPVEFVAYPVAGHHPSDPVRNEDVNRRWLAWLDTYLK